MLPNQEAIDKIMSIALMLGCTINTKLLFQRKHYSWPDLPSGYQRTISGSYSNPVGVKGMFSSIGITEVHLEEDPARWDPKTGRVDYNRSGFPLVEMVTEPEFTDPLHVDAWIKKLMSTLSYLNIIERSSGIKSDVNVSVAPDYQRVEIKNIHSFAHILAALRYEIARQQKEVAEGKEITHHTRMWSEARQKTLFMRTKEKAEDYMFIPDPDLPVISLSNKQIDDYRARCPRNPDERQAVFTSTYKLSQDDAQVLCSDFILADWFEQLVVKYHCDPKKTAQWLRREVLRVANYNNLELDELHLNLEHFADLITLVAQQKITESVGKKLLERLVHEDVDVRTVIETEGLGQLSGQDELTQFARDAITANPQAVVDYKAGKENALNFMIGHVMKQTKGKASPQEVKMLLQKLVDEQP